MLGTADWQNDEGDDDRSHANGSKEEINSENRNGNSIKNESDSCEDIVLLKARQDEQRLLDDRLGERDSIMEVNVEETIRRAVEINSGGPQVRLEKRIEEKRRGGEEKRKKEERGEGMSRGEETRRINEGDELGGVKKRGVER